MVARPTAPTRSANAGEFSADAAGRVDVKQYYAAGLAFKNVEPVPQGGFRQMGGTRRRSTWRRPIGQLAVTGASTTTGPHTGTQEVWRGNVAGVVSAVTVSLFAVSAGTVTFSVEAEVGGNWLAMSGPFTVTPEAAVTRMAAFEPGRAGAATRLRIMATFTEASTVAINSVTAWYESDGAPLPARFVSLTADNGTVYTAFVSALITDIYTRSSYVGAVPNSVAEWMLTDLDFYAEADTIGMFHTGLRTERIVLMTAHADWRRDNWPYSPIPLADLGGSYATVDDSWQVFIGWASDTDDPLYMSFSVDGNHTPSLQLPGGAINGSPDWTSFASAIGSALSVLPGLNASITVDHGAQGSLSHYLVVTFTGSLSGREYDFEALVNNTARISAVTLHYGIGSRTLEELFSAGRGWPGTAALVQDRLSLGRIASAPGAIAFSQAGEYFNYDLTLQGDSAARLDRIRSQTNETVLALKESNYLLVFTDRGVYFNTARVIDRNSPPNFVRASETGIQPGCRPFDLEGVDYYVAINPEGLPGAAAGGRQLMSIVYDDISTTYNAEPVSLLASHLVSGVKRSAMQRPLNDLDAAKGWLMRADGRLAAGQFVRTQEIVGFCEWIAADGGLVREIGVDAGNLLWIDVERGGHYSREIYDTGIFLQEAVTVIPNIAGTVQNLPFPNGTQVWARADGFDLGPFIVAGGIIELGNAYGSALVGRWQAPRFESMPQVYVTPGDEVILRPGRIHTVNVNVMETRSLAIGANGEAPADVALARIGDPADQPRPLRSEKVTVTGLPGAMEGTTLVITQAKPGELRVRDFSIGAKL